MTKSARRTGTAEGRRRTLKPASAWRLECQVKTGVPISPVDAVRSIGERRVYNRTPVGEPAVLQLDSVGFLVEHVLRAGRNLDVLGHIIADLQIRHATATDLGRIKLGAGIQNCRRFAEESFAGGQREEIGRASGWERG